MPRVDERLDRQYFDHPKTGTPMVKFRCFRKEDGQKAERWMSMPVLAFRWFRRHVVLKQAGGRGRPHLFEWPGPTRLRRVGNHDTLADYMRGLFGYLYQGTGRIPFRREEILGIANHLDLTPKLTGDNPNPNRDSTINPARLTRTVFHPGGQPARKG